KTVPFTLSLDVIRPEEDREVLVFFSVGVTVMTSCVEYKKLLCSSKVRVAGSLTLAGLCFLSSPLGWSEAWGQQSVVQLAPARTDAKHLAQSRTEARRQIRGFAAQPAPVQPAAPVLTPVALPVTNPS